jgi:hypothetical protein
MQTIKEAWANRGAWLIGNDGEDALKSALDELEGIRAIEFGSGYSTDLIRTYTNDVVSFDHDPNWMHSSALLRPLKNNFYAIKKGDIPWKANLVFIDGPPGTFEGGRAQTFPWCIRNKVLEDTCIIVVDDATRDAEFKMIKAWLTTYDFSDVRTYGRCARMTYAHIRQ